MMIRNLSKKYLVIQELECTQTVSQYLCRMMDQEDSRMYRAARQEILRVGADEIRFLMEQVKNENFTDFVDFFTDGDSLYVLMQYGAGISLREKLITEECSLGERLEIGKNLLERLLLLDLPPFFLNAAMTEDQVRVEKNGDVGLDYNLVEIDRFSTYGFSQGAEGIGRVFMTLYGEELRLKAIPELETMVYGLLHGEKDSLMDIYQGFLPIYRTWKRRRDGELEPKNFLFRLWDMVKAAGRLLKKLVMPAICLLAVAYLVLSVRNFFAPPGVKAQFTSIGTVQIENRETKTVPAHEAKEEETAQSDGAGEGKS